MKLYTVSLIIDNKEIHQEFINSDRSIEDLKLLLKPPYANIEIKLVDSVIKEMKCETIVKEVEKEYVDISIEKEMSDEESNIVRKLIDNKASADKDYNAFISGLNNKYSKFALVGIKKVKTTPKPTINKVVFDGVIHINDLKSL